MLEKNRQELSSPTASMSYEKQIQLLASRFNEGWTPED
jgi:hypothetical protein